MQPEAPDDLHRNGRWYVIHAHFRIHNPIQVRMGTDQQLPPEGPWNQVLQVIGHAHMLVHRRGVARIQTDLRVTTR